MRSSIWLLIGALLAGCASPPGVLTDKPAPISEIGMPVAVEPGPTVDAPTTPVEVPAAPPIAPSGQPPLPEPAPVVEAAQPPATPPQRPARVPLASLLPPGIPDKAGWASDMATAFNALRIVPSTENYCAAIAVIEQESSFRADPVVPGLNKIVWKEIDARRKKYALPRLAIDAAMRLPSPDGRSYKARIDALKTEKQMNALFEDMISELPLGKTLFSSLNPIRTGGPMQVSIEFAEAHVRGKPYPYSHKGMSIRDEVFTRRGGVYFGIANLLDYPAPYSTHLYRFADFNAGRYSSRNAAFQNAVAKLGKRKLELDGDLLRYEYGAPSTNNSATLNALLPLSGALQLSRAEIQRDLLQEKSASFAQTPLYQRLFTLADKKAGKPLPRELLPRIRLQGPKIQRKLTTAWFAKRVDGRYQRCLARGRSAGNP